MPGVVSCGGSAEERPDHESERHEQCGNHDCNVRRSTPMDPKRVHAHGTSMHDAPHNDATHGDATHGDATRTDATRTDASSVTPRA